MKLEVKEKRDFSDIKVGDKVFIHSNTQSITLKAPKIGIVTKVTPKKYFCINNSDKRYNKENGRSTDNSHFSYGISRLSRYNEEDEKKYNEYYSYMSKKRDDYNKITTIEWKKIPYEKVEQILAIVNS